MNTIERDDEGLLTKIEAEIEWRRTRRRIYASFWESRSKAVKERGIVCDFLKAVEIKNGSLWIKAVKANPHDPPDCVGTTFSGRFVAFEVTELVDKTAIEQNKATVRFWKEWPCPEFIGRLQAILSKKDQTQLERIYEANILIIHTDEPLLRPSECAEMLHQHTFKPCRELTKAYLLFSYCPGEQGYPYLPLHFLRESRGRKSAPNCSLAVAR